VYECKNETCPKFESAIAATGKEASLVYRQEIKEEAAEIDVSDPVAMRRLYGGIESITSDMTMKREAVPCEASGCEGNEVVFFQPKGKISETEMSLVFVCTTCHHKWKPTVTEDKMATARAAATERANENSVDMAAEYGGS